MNKIKYQLLLWETRLDIEKKGISKPVHEMIKLGLIKDYPNNHNYLLGRMQNEEFLKKLIKYKETLVQLKK